MKFECIIWDWNGTLLNDALLCREVMNGLLRRRRLPWLSKDRYEEIFDFPVHIYYERLGFDLGRDTFEALGSEFIHQYERYRNRCRLQNRARGLLHHLHSRRVRQAILSAYRHDTLVSLLHAKSLDRYFSWIAGADDHYARGKKEQGRRLLARIGCAPRRTLLIGDTVHDHDVAKSLGISCVLVYGGHQSPARLAACGAQVFGNLRELEKWLKELV